MKKAKLLPTPDGLTLDEIMERFSTDEKARAYFEAVRWAKGRFCPHCGNADEALIYAIAANPASDVRPGLYECGDKECRKQFTVTVKTIFEDSHIPLRKWLVAWYLLCSSKKGISALQMQRMLGLGSYRSAWHMMHRIRYALKQEPFKTKLQGIVEVDDTWIGGKKRFGPVHDKKGRSVRAGRDARENKAAVVAFLQRDGGVRSFHVDRVTGDNVRPILNEMVERGTHVMTDSANTMKVSKRGWKHSTVNHQKSEYVRREGDLVVTTNAVEGFFGNLKRGLNGVYHHVSRQHLPLYLAEFDFRYSERDSTDGDRMNEGVRKIEGKRLMLASPKKKE